MTALDRQELHSLATIWLDAWQDGQRQDVIEAMEKNKNPLRLAALVLIMSEGMDTQQRHDFANALTSLYLTADPRVATR